MFLMGRSAYALRDGDIAGHLAAYARDVTVVWPTGAEKGLAPLRRRAAAATWNGLDRRWLTPGEGFLRQLGPNRFRLDGTYHYFPGPTEMKVPFTAIWAKRRGRWEIVRQEIAAPVSVTPPRA